ncbi:lipopolysaccharide biosynthesis protein [Marmoricola sp. RAF53]|uniref:lipopolysaccharide biosynthesis protein n=1 Tax=Marmoricola sp. RAF53 TaxID=3233059 RepID=UPI003F9C7D72
MRLVLLSGISRLATIVPTAVAAIVLTRLIIGEYGINAFNGYSLILTLLVTLPVSSLGVGASVTDRYAVSGPDGPDTVAALRSSVRVLLLSALGTALAALVITAGGWWGDLLGKGSPTDWACLAAMLLFAVAFVPGLAVNVLLGSNKNHLVVIVQSLNYPMTLLLMVVLVWVAGPSGLVPVVPAIAGVLLVLVLAFLARPHLAVGWIRLLRQAPFRSRFPGGKIWSLSGPVLITQLAMPFSLAADRFVLSHVSTAGDLATYSVVVPIWAPGLGIIAALSQPLWPMWTKARAEGRSGPPLSLVLLGMAGVGAAISLFLAVLTPFVVDLISDGKVDAGTDVLLASGLCLVVAGLSYPMTMRLMYPAGARVMAALMLISAPLNVVVSIFLAEKMGASGPLFATAAVGFLVGTLPAIVFDRLHVRTDEPAEVETVPTVPVA